MSFQLYLRPVPRTLVLVAATTALVFRRPDKPDARAEIELVPVDSVDLAGMVRVNRGRAVGGVLGLLSIPVGTTHEIFLLVASGAIALPPLLSGTSLTPSKLLSVEFHCLSSQLWDDPSLVPASTASSSSTGLAGVFDDFELDREQDIGGAYSSSSSSAAAVAQLGHPCDGMKRYLETGTFYFATNGTWDISRGLSSWNWRTMRDGQGQADPAAVLEGYDERFVWNSNILAPLLHFRSHLSPAWRTHLDDQHMLVPLIQGFTNSIPILQPRAAQPLHLALISRLGWKRAGARFKTRGVDDQGNVANFVETETIVSTAGSCMSFVQVRGSVPLFWEQQGSQAFGHKLQITRPQAASQAAFDKHFLDLVAHYGSVHAINLLGGGESEQVLSDAYNKHLMSLVRTMADAASGDDEDAGKTTIEPEVTLTVYDFHAMVRAGGHDIVKRDFEGRIQPVKEARERFGWTLVDRSRGELVETQKGVFRTNCLDCLDRTNYVEDVISSFTTSTFITQLSTPESPVSLPMVLAAHRGLWADNGDALSRIYAGTGALNTSVTRSGGKRGWGALLSDASKSLGRAYQATFADQEKQISIDLFLGIMAGQKTVQVYDPISDAIQDQLKARLPEYSSSKKVRIFCGTWNLNGKPLSGNFGMWLFPEGLPPSDIYCIAFQELVPLNAQQILQTDPAARRRCEELLSKAFTQHLGEGEYVLLRSEQLVGTAIFAFVRSELLPHTTRVEGASRKTGLRGMSGNKGGCGIRFDLYDTSVCLMTCHLAAGHSNLSERNADYKTISRELTFQKGRRIKDHELIFWCADLNYRIDLTNEEVREKIEDGDFQPLWEADQLRNAMVYKDAFEGYQEGKINFAPTYKFDTGSDIYDTSEKQRIPAWTDRVLYKGENLEQTSYDIAHVRTSDHRPVYATFKTEVHIIDHAKEDSIRAALKKQLLKQEHGTDKGVRPPPPLPVSKKPRNHTPLEDAFLDLQGNGAEEQGGNTNPSGKSDKMGGDRGSKAGAKPIPPPRPPKPVSSAAAKGSLSPISSSVEDGFVKIRHHATGSTNASSTSLHTMSPLSNSMQNVAAAATAAVAGGAGPAGSSALRRVPPALPALPGRPVPGRPARSGSKSTVIMSTLDVVDEKQKSSSSKQADAEKPGVVEQRLSLGSTSGEASGHGASGVARLIAEANRRATSGDSPTAATSHPNTSRVVPPIPVSQETPLTRSVPALPARTLTSMTDNGIKGSTPDLISGTSTRSQEALPLRTQQPPRKGSLNASTHITTPTLSAESRSAVGSGARSMSMDSVGQVRRMPPPLSSAAGESGMKSGQGGGDRDRPAVDVVDSHNGGGKKVRPAVPPKPVHL